MRCVLGLCLAPALGACGGGEASTSDGELVCEAVRASDAVSCSVDNTRKVIFATYYFTTKDEAVFMCHGMLSEMRKHGVTGWRVTIRSASWRVLATCKG